VTWANDTEYGLAASVWSADVDHALRLARKIESGSVFVNSHRVGSSDQTMPFGGMKQSGLGRNHGMWAIEECMELQAISHRPDTSAFPGPPDI
jgi:aldehyde dehydrogenase